MARHYPDLSEILAAQNEQAPRVERHLWLISLMDWLRGRTHDVHAVYGRLGLLLDAIENNPTHRRRWQCWWPVFFDNVDATTLFADHGFAPRTSFISELGQRLRHKILPQTPDTADMSELFDFLFPSTFDIVWLRYLEPALLQRIQRTLFYDPRALASDVPPSTGEIQPQPADGDYVSSLKVGQRLLIDALTYSVSQVSATGFASEIRYRMSDAAQSERTFHELPLHFERFRVWVEGTGPFSEASLQSAEVLRQQLDACRLAANSVYAHLDQHGISVGIVFRLRQLRERVIRIKTLLNCLQGEDTPQEIVRLLIHLIQVSQEGRSIRSLIARSTHLTAAKVAERSAETGQHYIARDMGEYCQMLRQAAGGGIIVGLTTWAKFVLVALGLSSFWGGMAASINYACSFVIIMLLHWTLATKQPAVTASAMAAKLKDWEEGHGVEGFVNEATLLMRSQFAAIIGNIGLVVPTVLIVSFILQYNGSAMLDSAYALHTLHDIALPGYTVLYAAFTGVLLFVSSIIAGWFENWYVLQRFDSALRYNPRITAFLGLARANRWAKWLRKNVSGLAANISLGFLLGLTPAFLDFFGLGLEVRHITLASGQVAAATFVLGSSILLHADFWWAIAGLLAIAPLNLGVSFYLAFRVALRANNISRINRRMIQSALLRAWFKAPLTCFFPRYTQKATPEAEKTPDV